jgi:SAM-dependent methyltransferase
MTIDVIDLRDFYSQRLGIVARQLINRGIRARWPDAAGQRVLGLGYPTPYLGLFRDDSERCIAFMPAAQGVLKWPTARPALATLIDEFSMPLPDAAVDRILLVHALEMSDDPERLLREVWRVLAPSGRLIAVIPNRRGVWTRTDNTPFGHGRPYSRAQRRCSCRRSATAGSCARQWRGSALALRCRCRSPACISWKRPSRSIARSQRTANARG